MSITIELCNYDRKKNCLHCDFNYKGFCFKHKLWCNFAIRNCDEYITTMQVRAKRQIHRCKIYRYIPEINAVIKTIDKTYKVRGGFELHPKLLSDEQIEAIIEKYKEGATVEQLAEWYFVSQSTIRTYIREVMPLRGSKKRKERPALDQKRIGVLVAATIEEVEEPIKTDDIPKEETKRGDKQMDCRSCLRVKEAYHKIRYAAHASNMNVTVDLLEDLVRDLKTGGLTKEQIEENIENIVSFIKYNAMNK